MKHFKNLLLISGVLAVAFINVQSIFAATTVLNMKVNPWITTIWAPSALAFTNAVVTSDQSQTLEQSFNGSGDYFYIQDLKWANAGYSTTLQVAWPLTDGVNSIPASNIAFKTVAGSASLLLGLANPRVTLDASASSYQDLSTPRTFILRNTAANNGTVSKYGTQIAVKVTIPARQPVGDYTTSLVYTLIES